MDVVAPQVDRLWCRAQDHVRELESEIEWVRAERQDAQQVAQREQKQAQARIKEAEDTAARAKAARRSSTASCHHDASSACLPYQPQRSALSKCCTLMCIFACSHRLRITDASEGSTHVCLHHPRSTAARNILDGLTSGSLHALTSCDSPGMR